MESEMIGMSENKTNVTRDLKVTIRVSPAEKQKLREMAGDKPISTFIRDLLLSPGIGSVGDIENDGLKDDLIFMFNFFQKNSKNLVLSDSDRIKLKKILEKVRR